MYNTLCRVFPRRFVLPLDVDWDTAYDQNLNTRHSSTATAIRIGQNKVSVPFVSINAPSSRCACTLQVYCTHEDLHGEDLHRYGGLEFPQINYMKYNTRPYRYFYGCGFRHLVGDSLIKMDVHSKSMKVAFKQSLPLKKKKKSKKLNFVFSLEVWEQPGFYPSEPVFVPSPAATEEDDGVVLSVVITPNKVGQFTVGSSFFFRPV